MARVSTHIPREYHKEAIRKVNKMLDQGGKVIAISKYGFVIREGKDEISVVNHPTDGLQIEYSYEK